MLKPIRTFFTHTNRLKNKIIGMLIAGTHDHYFSVLPPKKGMLLSLSLRGLFSGIKLVKDTSIEERITEDAIIVYTTKYKSNFDFLFYHTRLSRDAFPAPVIGFDYNMISYQPLGRIVRVVLSRMDYFLRYFTFPNPYDGGYYQRALLDGNAGFFSLIEKKGVYRRFVQSQTDPIQFLISLQQTTQRPVIVIPLLFFFSTEPHRSELSLIDIFFGTRERPGKIRRFLMLFKTRRKIFAEMSEPLNLKHYLTRSDIRNMSINLKAQAMRHDLITRLNRHRQSIIGPILKSREELKQSILMSHKLQREIKKHALKRGCPVTEVYKETSEFFEEIAANYSQNWIRIFYIVLRMVFRTMFEGVIVDQEGLKKIKQAAKKAPLILIPCHKSHLDYLILSYVFYVNNLPCPHIAAGKNLSFWPLGTMFRGAGAFFIRRTFKGAVLYSKVFSAYVFKLLEEGFNIELFIEGGRSRTGKLLTPKLGGLSIILNAFKEDACDDLIFVPIFIGYDKILEEKAYLHEIEGGQKQPEDLKQVISARKFLKNRYGKIYMRFHDPISLKDHLAENKTRISEMSSKEFNGLTRYLGNKLIHAIDSVSVVTPHGLVAAAILNCSKTRFSYEHLMVHLDTYMNYLVATNATLTDTLLVDPKWAFDNVLETFIQQRFLENGNKEFADETSQQNYIVPENKRPGLDYYKNNCIALFTQAMFTAMAILKKDAFLFTAADLYDSYTFLSNLMLYEFSCDVDHPPEFYVRKSIKAFITDAILIPHPSLPDTYNITSVGFRKLKFFANFLKTYLESYLAALNYFRKTPKDDTPQKERAKKIHTLAARMYKKKEISRYEAISKINTKNADTFFKNDGINGAEDKEKIDYYISEIQKYLNFL